MQGCLLIRSYFLEITVNVMSKEELIAKNNKSTYEWIQCLIVALAVCAFSVFCAGD